MVVLQTAGSSQVPYTMQSLYNTLLDITVMLWLMAFS